jgi:hypothetical protein
VPQGELPASPRTEKPGSAFEQQSASFLVVDPARRAHAEDGQRRAAGTGPRSCVSLDLVDRRASRIGLRNKATRRDEDDLVPGGGKGGERGTRHNGEWQPCGSDGRSNARQKRVWVWRIAHDPGFGEPGLPLDEPVYAHFGCRSIGSGTHGPEPLASQCRKCARARCFAQAGLQQKFARARSVHLRKRVPDAFEAAVRVFEGSAQVHV